MDIDDLRTFVDVADAGGVSLAARRLGVAKSIVSRRLARLESELGVQLLSRNTRGAALTEAGSTFREYAARITAELDAARDSILPAGELRGRLRVAAPLSFGATHVAPVLAEMARRYPRLEIHASYSDRFVDLVADGYDCGIRMGYLQDSSMIARRVGPVHGSLVASPRYIAKNGSPENPEELLGHELLMQGAETWQFLDGEEVINVKPHGRFKADNGAALLVAATAGLGIAWLPDGITHPYLTSGELVTVMDRYPVPPAGAYVVRPPGAHTSRKITVLTELLVEHCAKAPLRWDRSAPKRPRTRPRAR